MTEEKFSRFLPAVMEAVKKHLADSPGCHDFDHTMRVTGNALFLCEKIPEADREITILAAVLHDVARPEELASKGKVCHARQGAVIAEKILLDTEAPAELAKKVSACVRTHRYRGGETPESLEAKILYDADKLDSLGAVGVGRAFLFAGREGAKLHNTREAALAAPEYSREDTAYREYLVKLSRLPDVMLTEAGREEGEKRLAFMKNFFDQLNEECRINGKIK